MSFMEILVRSKNVIFLPILVRRKNVKMLLDELYVLYFNGYLSTSSSNFAIGQAKVINISCAQL